MLNSRDENKSMLMDKIKSVKMPTIWKADGNVIKRGWFNDFTNVWLWGPVAKCSCPGAAMNGTMAKNGTMAMGGNMMTMMGMPPSRPMRG